LAASKSVPIVRNASVSDAAANTVTVSAPAVDAASRINPRSRDHQGHRLASRRDGTGRSYQLAMASAREVGYARRTR
jgi:hypothetical protein